MSSDEFLIIAMVNIETVKSTVAVNYLLDSAVHAPVRGVSS